MFLLDEDMWADKEKGHVPVKGVLRNSYRILAGKPEFKKQHGRPKSRCGKQ
jgi:hypothetical protein